MEKYLIKNFEGINKSKFTVALNIANDNCKNKGIQELLKEAQRSKGGITDTQITEVQEHIKERLNSVRNYFSHCYHEKKPLYFEANDPVKIFLEETFAKAVENLQGRFLSDKYKLTVPPLFEPNQNNTITAAGVIFLASFFCHRSYVYRMLGGIPGFKRSDKKKWGDGQKIDYGFTRKLMSFYSLRDSYSVNVQENKELTAFRDILGYLARVPGQAIDWLIEKGKLTKEEGKQFYLGEQSEEREEKAKKEEIKYALRKTDKFMLFAVRFIEDWAEQERIKVEFARYEKMTIVNENKKQDEKEERKVKFVSDEPTAAGWTYYIRNNHAIIKIIPDDKKKKAVSARISENELKYLVLTIIDGNGKNAIAYIGDYIFRTARQIENKSYNAESEKYAPAFVRGGQKKSVDKRIKYIRDEIQQVINDIEAEQEKQKNEQDAPAENRTWLIYKGKKISIILRYVNDNIAEYKKRLSVTEYNELRGYLQQLDFINFHRKLAEYQHHGRLPNGFAESINKFQDLSKLCIEVCERQKKKLQEMAAKGGIELEQYIGLAPKEENQEQNKYATKANNFIKVWLSIPENFLRQKFYDKFCKQQECKNKGSDKPDNTSVPQRKYFIAIIREKNIRPIHADKYYLLGQNPKDYERPDGKIIRQLCDVYCKDGLCMAMAKWYYENRLGKFKDLIEWQTGDDKQQHGYAGHTLEYQATEKIKIRFKLADFTRLDIIEPPERVKNICRQWETELLKKTRDGTISWYDFKLNGLEPYRQWQGYAVADIFWFEESLKINETQWQGRTHMPFNFEKDKPLWCNILDEAVKQNKIEKQDTQALRRVRHDCFHEEFLANYEQLKIFKNLISDKAKDAKPKDKKSRKNEQKYGKR